MNARHRATHAAGVAGVTILLASSARAVECPDPTTKTAFELGVAAYNEDRFPDALESFRLAALCGSEALLYQAQALIKLRRYAEAVALLRAYLGTRGVDETKLAPVRQLSERLERENTGQIVLTVNELGASIRVDGFAVGTSPLAAPLIINNGEYDVRVEKQGFEPLVQRLRIVPGTTQVVNVALRVAPQPGVVPPPRARHEPPPPSVPPPPVDSRGRTGDRRTSGPPLLPIYMTGGIAAAALGVGSFFGIKASSTWSQATTRCPNGRCPDPNDLDLDDKAGRYADVATVSFVVAGVSLATTVTMLLLR